MSSDLLAEFDSFYRAPQDKNSSSFTPASSDLSALAFTQSSGSALPQQVSTHLGYSNNLGSVGERVEAGQEDGLQHWHTTAPQSSGRTPLANSSWQSGRTTSNAADVGKNNIIGFNGISQQWQSSGSQPTGFMGQMTNSSNQSSTSSAQNDVWGSFDSMQPPHQSNAPKSIYVGAGGIGMSSPKPEIVRRPTLDLFSPNLHQFPSSKSQSKTQPLSSQPVQVPKTQNADVLFDADEIDDDDDFGDFESVAPEPPALAPVSTPKIMGSKYSKRPADLLSSTTTMPILPYPQAPKSPSFQERNPFAELNLSTKSSSDAKAKQSSNSPSPVTAWPTYEAKAPKHSLYVDSPTLDKDLDEDWGDFADLPPETPGVPKVEVQAESWDWDTAEQVVQVPISSSDTPIPTNIPPPSVLLSIFPSIFDLPQSSLFKQVGNQPFSLKNRIISDPATIDFLRAYLLIATVAARVIAGRKLRWKRDTILSQSMKIGPAAAGGKGGMKLAGVDKSETTKEDREASDVVRLWKEQLGRLKSAIAVANSSMQDTANHLAIPDLSESMHIKTLPGGLTAPKHCLVCGLKREERVNKVDVDVEDSFGEWWTEHWGHRACRNFWLEHQVALRQR